MARICRPRRRRTIGASLSAAGTWVGSLACFALPIFFGDAQPAAIHEFSPASTLALAVGLGITFDPVNNAIISVLPPVRFETL